MISCYIHLIKIIKLPKTFVGAVTKLILRYFQYNVQKGNLTTLYRIIVYVIIPYYVASYKK